MLRMAIWLVREAQLETGGRRLLARALARYQREAKKVIFVGGENRGLFIQ